MMGVCAQLGAPASAAKAAQAGAVATTMAAVEGLLVEEAGRTSSGAIELTLAAEGKVMAEAKGAVPVARVVALQRTGGLAGGVQAEAEAAPAYSVVPLEGQGVQEVAPGTLANVLGAQGMGAGTPSGQ